jgi:hypothetical protein
MAANGFHLDLSDNSSSAALGTDSSGNSNDWTVNNFSVSTVDAIYAEFSGSSSQQYLRKSGSGVLPSSNGSFTLECHFYPHTTDVIALFDAGPSQNDIFRNYPNNTIERLSGGSVSIAGDYTQNAWNHLAVVYDGYADTMTVYVNGTSSGTASFNSYVTGNNFDIGAINGGGDGKFDGFIRNFRVTHSVVYSSEFTAPSHTENLTALTDTKLLALTTSGEGLTGDASTNNYTLTNNGFVTSVTQSSPASNDSLIDTPTNYEATPNNGGNYCTLNPLDRQSTNGVLSNGNLDIKQTATAWAMYRSTMFLSSGKHYWEVTIGNNQYTTIGICASSYSMSEYTNAWANQDTDMFGYYPYDGIVYNGGNTISYATGDTSASGSVVGVALDMDNGTLTFYKDGTSLGQATSALAGKSWSPTHWLYNQTNADSYNFGQRPFAFPPGGTGGPSSDHKSLCTTNLPDPTIADGSTAMDVVLYTGTRANQVLTFGMQPDFVWAKNRSTGAYNHVLTDSVRGAQKVIFSNLTNAEQTSNSIIDWSYGTNQVQLGDYGQSSETGDSYVAWAWDAGSSNTTISVGSSNSTAYNQSAVWSSMCSPTPNSNTFANGFDGNTATTFFGGISAGSYFTFTPTGGITFTDKIRVYNGNVSGASYKYNNGSATSFPINSWTTVATGGGTMTSFAVTRNTTAVHGWYAIEVDGKILVDQGATPAVGVPSIASTVRANPSAGFSIVSYTGNGTNGATVGHGLSGVENGMIIVKNRSSTLGPWWAVFHTSLTTGKVVGLNSSQAEFDETYLTRGIIESVTSSTYSCTAGSAGNQTANGNGDTHIAYCFAPVEGYSAFGSYTGNGSTDGPFVFTGMRPKWLLLKRTDSAKSWQVIDTERSAHNVTDDRLFPDDSGAESSSSNFNLDILSNGFKCRTAHDSTNVSGGTYIYAAFAENPFSLNGGLAR